MLGNIMREQQPTYMKTSHDDHGQVTVDINEDQAEKLGETTFNLIWTYPEGVESQLKEELFLALQEALEYQFNLPIA